MDQYITPILFWVFSLGLIASGLGVVLNRNPVGAALSLVSAIIFLALLFGTLQAFFLATIQVLVYAGAVMVLFLFIIMLLDLPAEEKRSFSLPAVGFGVLCVALFLLIVSKVLIAVPLGEKKVTDIQPPPVKVVEVSGRQVAQPEEVATIGRAMFSTYLLPFQVIGVMLLIATVGVVLLSIKRGGNELVAGVKPPSPSSSTESVAAKRGANEPGQEGAKA